MDFQQITSRTPDWLTENVAESDVVLSSRARLARNLQNFNFVERASENDLRSIIKEVKSTIFELKTLKGVVVGSIDQLSQSEQNVLVERRLVTSDFIESEKPKEFAFLSDESFSLMVNEEDHLRFQVSQPGFQLDHAWEKVHRIDQEISDWLPYMVSDELGYLTTCPSNVGSGVRFSVFVHLPALQFLKEIDDVFDVVTPAGVAIHGIYGESEKGVGSFFQISNQYTLGWKEIDLLKRLISLIDQLIEKERDARKRLLSAHALRVEDKVFRAVGILSHAKMISSIELLEFISALRLGIDLGIINGLPYGLLNEMLILCQPAHLQMQVGYKMEKMEIDRLRASIIQHKLNLSSIHKD